MSVILKILVYAVALGLLIYEIIQLVEAIKERKARKQAENNVIEIEDNK